MGERLDGSRASAKISTSTSRRRTTSGASGRADRRSRPSCSGSSWPRSAPAARTATRSGRWTSCAGWRCAMASRCAIPTAQAEQPALSSPGHAVQGSGRLPGGTCAKAGAGPAAGPSACVARQAIHGLGGVGKTRWPSSTPGRTRPTTRRCCSSLADTPANLRRTLAELVGPLVLDLKEVQDVKEEEPRFAAAVRWLESHPGWFLILDNVDTEEAAREAMALLPRLQRGHVVITSRLSKWRRGVRAAGAGCAGRRPGAGVPAGADRRSIGCRRQPMTPTPVIGRGAGRPGAGVGAGRSLHQRTALLAGGVSGSVAEAGGSTSWSGPMSV